MINRKYFVRSVLALGVPALWLAAASPANAAETATTPLNPGMPGSASPKPAPASGRVEAFPESLTLPGTQQPGPRLTPLTPAASPSATPKPLPPSASPTPKPKPVPKATQDTLKAVAVEVLGLHPVLKADRAIIRAADHGVSVARSALFPTLSATAEANQGTFGSSTGNIQRNGRAVGLEAQLPLWDGLRTFNRTFATEAERQGLQSDYNANANVILNQAVRAFVGVIRDRLVVDAARRNMQEHASKVAQVAAAVAIDSGKRFDLVQLQSREAFAASLLTEREGALQATISQFREIVGREAGAGLQRPDVPTGPWSKSLPTALDWAQKNHPSVRAAERRVARSQFEYEQTRGAYSPRLDGVLRTVRGVDRQAVGGLGDEQFAGLQAAWPFPLGGEVVYSQLAAQETLKAAQERRASVARDVREATRVAWAQRAALDATIPNAAQHLLRAREVLAGFQNLYTLGRRSMLDLLIMQNEVYQAEARLIALRHDMLIAEFNLAAQVGALESLLIPAEPSAVKAAASSDGMVSLP